MNALVTYDSRYGNTKKIAVAIGDGLSSALGASGSVQVINVADARPDQLAGWELLLVGGPTHGTRPSPPMHEFLTRLPQNALAGVKVAAFDTRVDPHKQEGALRVFAKILDRFGYAAAKIASALVNKGGQVVKAPEGFIVLGMEGPLEDGELQRATEWGGQVVASLNRKP